ncbi:MAG TPA: hypothetical protein VM076_13405 [Gemmatimonadaceae bacterium]|nr:hypothetical protein [Gemmatimonadaceae bacterium]
MRKTIAVILLCTAFVLEAHAARRVVRTRTVRGTRTRVVVRTGFPIRRTLPNVVVRPYTVRVAPRVYLGAVVFGAVAVATLPPANVRSWSGSEELDREDGWSDFSLDVDRRGTRLLLEIDDSPAEISFAEVVFENGETQVVDFNEKTLGRGIYSLLDFKDGRKVDHVRVVAQAKGKESDIRVHLIS